jgi:hypothetical protein
MTAQGFGAAHGPGVVAADDVAALRAALAVAMEVEQAERAATEGARNIAGLEAKIVKLEGHLAGARAALVAAKSAMEN